MRRPSRALVAGGLAAAIGCGSGSSGGGAIPFPAFEPTALAALCRLEVICLDYPDAATCLASDQVQPHYYDTVGGDIASGKVVYDGIAARTCIDAINGLTSCGRTFLSGVLGISACDRIFTGTVATGGACFFSPECAGGATCAATGSCTFGQCCAGTCQAPPVTVPPGADCSTTGDPCANGTVCLADATSGNGTCQPPAAAGGACNAQNACANGLYCDTPSGTCKALVATGGACNPSLAALDCDNYQDVCDPTAAVCTPPLAVGSPCTGASVTGNCVSYAFCDSTSGTCLARPGVGAACGTGGGDCLGGGTCDATTATCTLLPVSGACS